MDIITDLEFLKIPTKPVASKSEGLKIGKQIIATLNQVNKRNKKQKDRAAGVGLAANQIGLNKSVCVVKARGVWRVLINPQIIEHSEEAVESVEGCLSMPGVQKKVLRWEWIKISTSLTHGERFEGFVAYIIQHEIDHLNGITINERALDEDSLS